MAREQRQQREPRISGGAEWVWKWEGSRKWEQRSGLWEQTGGERVGEGRAELRGEEGERCLLTSAFDIALYRFYNE